MPLRVSVIIPTRRRPEGLRRAVRSVLSQEGLEPGDFEIVVVDNEPFPAARLAVEGLRAEAGPVALRYRHEAAPGVASARNAAMPLAAAPLLAYLDDDEEASGVWLSELLAVQRRLHADVVFGPVRGAVAEGVPHRAFLEDFFSRKGPSSDGLAQTLHGCGNSLIRQAVLPDLKAPFDCAFNLTGGEDDVLFRELRARGARFGWAAAAVVFEHPDEARLRLRYALRRAFAYGQGGTRFRAAYGSPALAAFSMATGLGQALLFGLIGVFALILRLELSPFLLDRAARGFGKLFWGSPFQLSFYGLELEDSDPPRGLSKAS